MELSIPALTYPCISHFMRTVSTAGRQSLFPKVRLGQPAAIWILCKRLNRIDSHVSRHLPRRTTAMDLKRQRLHSRPDLAPNGTKPNEDPSQGILPRYSRRRMSLAEAESWRGGPADTSCAGLNETRPHDVTASGRHLGPPCPRTWLHAHGDPGQLSEQWQKGRQTMWTVIWWVGLGQPGSFGENQWKLARMSDKSLLRERIGAGIPSGP